MKKKRKRLIWDKAKKIYRHRTEAESIERKRKVINRNATLQRRRDKLLKMVSLGYTLVDIALSLGIMRTSLSVKIAYWKKEHKGFTERYAAAQKEGKYNRKHNPEMRAEYEIMLADRKRNGIDGKTGLVDSDRLDEANWEAALEVKNTPLNNITITAKGIGITPPQQGSMAPSTHSYPTKKIAIAKEEEEEEGDKDEQLLINFRGRMIPEAEAYQTLLTTPPPLHPVDYRLLLELETKLKLI